MLDLRRGASLSMSPPALSISQIGPESDVLLRNLFEHYIHDMAEWFAIDTRADGSYSYDTSPLWENGCDVYIARAGDSIAGFAIVGWAAGWLPGDPVRDMREFFVIRRFRRSGFGQTMAANLWNRYPGEWLVRVLSANAAAVLFWRAAISRHSHGSFSEDSRSEDSRTVNGRQWLYFRFSTGA